MAKPAPDGGRLRLIGPAVALRLLASARRHRSVGRRVPIAFSLVSVLSATALTSCSQATTSPSRQLVDSLHELVLMQGGPPGAIAVVQDGSKLVVDTAGTADRSTGRRVVEGDAMRLASVSKAYNGAVALALVSKGKLALTDTVGAKLPGMYPAWAPVTLEEMLKHTSGLPDYTKSPTFVQQIQSNPQLALSPQQLIQPVAPEPPLFTPGSRYEYSDTDNIVVGLMAESASGQSYDQLLHQIVLDPLQLTRTFLPADVAMPEPILRGYDFGSGVYEDVTTVLNPALAWASGGIVSTPAELNRFVRAYAGGRFGDAATRAAQFSFVTGESSPPGPGTNSAGLALFRYQTSCGTVYGHTGNYPGYTQFAAASEDGSRSVTLSASEQLNPQKQAKVFAGLRQAEELAVCAAFESSSSG